MRPLTRIGLAFLFFAQLSFIGFAQSGIIADSTEASVREVAKTALEPFLNKIPPGHEAEYGFKNREEFSRANLGMAVQVFTIHPDSIRNRIDPKRTYMIPPSHTATPGVPMVVPLPHSPSAATPGV
jgi:hypothetical protein